MTKQADLIAYLSEGQQSSAGAQVYGALMQWMDASSRFTAFVEIYRDKIRKKIRVTRDPESALDLRSELEVAYRLLNDRRLAVTYEPYASAKRRGADFTVTYRTNLVFNIEVARIRADGSGAELSQADDPPAETGSPPKAERILRILLYKLGQMQPGMGNLLAIHTPAALAKTIDLNQQMQGIKTRVEGKDPAFYALSSYSSPAAFYKDFLHLSGILLWGTGGQLWINKQARPGLDEKVQRLVNSLLTNPLPEI